MAQVTVESGNYVTTPQTVVNPDGSLLSPGVNASYESHEFNVNDSTTNYDVKTTQSAFATVTSANKILLRSDSTITFKLNDTSNHAITLTSLEEFIEIDFIQITNIYITNNSGGTAAVKLLMA